MSTKAPWKNKLSIVTKYQLNPAMVRNINQSSILWYPNYLTRLIVVTIMIYRSFTRTNTDFFDRGGADLWYNFTTAAFLFALFFAWLGYTTSRNIEKKLLCRVLFLVNGMSMLSYVVVTLRLGIVMRDGNGYPVDLIRYVVWITTCPSLSYLVGEITKSREKGARIAKYDYLLLVAGFMASITKEPYSLFCSIISMIGFVVAVMGLDSMFANATRNGSNLDSLSLRISRIATIFNWSLFPIIWFATKYRILSFARGEMMYCLADIGAKVFLTLVLVNATVDQSQNERVVAISEIASDLEDELNSSDALLSKMMPTEVLEQLKSGCTPLAEEYGSVTVFFSDIANFTLISSQSSPSVMLKTLDLLWQRYDEIAERHGMYKVEAIGDAYLGVIGCPCRISNHAEKAIDFSIDIINMIACFDSPTRTPIEIRIGLSSGPVTAGILGTINPRWCIVGDTVNTASRMESSSLPMQVHISQSTYDLVEGLEKYILSDPDEVEVKGKGEMTTYWIRGLI